MSQTIEQTRIEQTVPIKQTRGRPPTSFQKPQVRGVSTQRHRDGSTSRRTDYSNNQSVELKKNSEGELISKIVYYQNGGSVITEYLSDGGQKVTKITFDRKKIRYEDVKFYSKEEVETYRTEKKEVVAGMDSLKV